MHPYISRGIAAERVRDMQARAAQDRRARQAHSATKATRRVFSVARLWTRPSGRVATLVTPVPVGRGRADTRGCRGASRQPGASATGCLSERRRYRTFEDACRVVRRLAPQGHDGSGILWSDLDQSNAAAIIAPR